MTAVRPTKKRATRRHEPVEVRLTAQLWKHLDALLATGLYGPTLGDVVIRLLEHGVQNAWKRVGG